ncbi:MAG TPA: hypothetical protein VL122_08100 [Nitrospirota bacterium]|nr:hypothetical protein [Nitrospirota bacterium]
MLVKEHPDIVHAEHNEEFYHASFTGLKPADYFRQAKYQLRVGKQKEAFALLQQSIIHFPNDPVLLSYYGCLLVLVEKKYRMGIETCLKALKKLQTKGAFDEEVVYPALYYNLGRAYAGAGKRKEALDALKKGLSYDRWNSDIIKEMRSMGIRREKPPIPFLKRSNSLNVIIGIMFYKKNYDSDATKKVSTLNSSGLGFPKLEI